MNQTEQPNDNNGTDGYEDTISSDKVEYSTAEADERPRRSVHPGAIAAGITALVLIFFLVIWYFYASGGEAGRPVPAPRTTTDTMPQETLAGQTLTLSPEQVSNAGIELQTVGEQMASESAETSATGTIEANAYRQTPAVALVGGIVRRVVPELGDNVGAGQTVAVIFSDDFAATQSRYIALAVETQNARQAYDRAQRLATINQPGRSEVEQATKQRRAAEAALNEMRNRFDRTTRLVKIGAASREDLEQDTTKLRTAEAELDEARLRETRAGQLLPIGPEVRAAAEEALNKLRTAESELAATRQRLILYGMPAARVNSLRSASHVTSELAVPAPISGTVTSRAVNAGEVVEANKELLRITDLSSVWVIAQVYERDLARLRVASGASVSSDAFPNRLFRGQITYIDPQIDEATRTAKVRVQLDNPGRVLKIGMYVRIAFGATGNAERTVPVIPKSAVQEISGQRVVFLPTADPNIFELRPVRLGNEGEGRYEVLEGLQVGDKVVANGSFVLRAEWLKTAQTSEHAH